MIKWRRRCFFLFLFDSSQILLLDRKFCLLFNPLLVLVLLLLLLSLNKKLSHWLRFRTEYETRSLEKKLNDFSLSYCSVSKTPATIQQHGPIIRYGRTWALIIEDRGKISVQACWILKTKKRQKMIGTIRLLLLYWIEYVWEDKSSEILFFLLLWGHGRSRRASLYKLFRKGHQRTMDRGYSNMCMLMKVTGWW